MKTTYIVLLILVVVFCVYNKSMTVEEQFEAGQFCYSCNDKTFNQCTTCFNCGYCVDRNGRGKCIGGDHKGPYNYEHCAKWYHGDPFSRMLQNNKCN